MFLFNYRVAYEAPTTETPISYRNIEIQFFGVFINFIEQGRETKLIPFGVCTIFLMVLF